MKLRRLGCSCLATAALAAAVAVLFAGGSRSAQAVNAAKPNPFATVAQAPTDPQRPQDYLKQLGISGYADPLSVQPGQTVTFRVSSEHPRYHASIVRVISGDPDPRGPGIREQVVQTPANGDYPGVHQELRLGSYVTVPDARALRLRRSFTITGWIAPTTVPGSTRNPLAFHRTPAGTPRPQGLVTKWDARTERGYGLFLDSDGSLALWLGRRDGSVAKVRTAVPLHPWTPALPGVEPNGGIRPQMVNARWYFVAASYDAATGRVNLYQLPQQEVPDPTRAVVSKQVGASRLARTRVPVLMAAYSGQDGRPDGLYNGKLDSPRIFARALSAGDIAAVRSGHGPEDAVAAWDFSRDIPTSAVRDASPNHLDGRAVNLPLRATTGHNWDTSEMDWTKAPEQYGAIYFHDDDLADARWRPSFKFRVPENLPSGYYAAKLTAGNDEYHVAFFVRPRRPTARVAFLVPTNSYLAYGQTGGVFTYALSQYSRHDDGSGWVYSTRLRPITNMRSNASGPRSDPRADGPPWQYEADTHITDWLESTGIKVDYITDSDLNREGSKLLAPYKVVLTASHPEYTTDQEEHAIKSYLSNGGRLMYLGGNGFYWVTVLDPTGTFTEVRRHDGTEGWQAAPGDYYHSLTGEFGGLWRFRGFPPQELVGVGFTAQGFDCVCGPGDYSRPYHVNPDGRTPAAAFVFRDVGLDEAIGDFPSLQNPGGAAGEELDRYDYTLGSPVNTLVLATANGFGDEYQFVVEEINTSNGMSGGSINPLVKADLTLSYYPHGGAVFSVSSISWAGSLFYNHYDNNVARITGNVLREFASGQPLPDAQS